MFDEVHHTEAVFPPEHQVSSVADNILLPGEETAGMEEAFGGLVQVRPFRIQTGYANVFLTFSIKKIHQPNKSAQCTSRGRVVCDDLS